MKIKVKPEDFIVKEILKLQPSKSGKFVLYRIEKRGWSTLELLSYVRMKYGIEIKHAGLKDKHSLSVQYGTSLQDYPVIKGNGFLIQKIGYWWGELGPSDIEGNHFLIKVRDINNPTLLEALKEAAKGFPNYFDEQRFGSRTNEGLIGEMLLRGEAEKALFLYMTTLRNTDSASMKDLKKYVKENWRNWEQLENLVPGQFKPVFRKLKEGRSFMEAWAAFPRGLLSIILTAVQSYYWNLLLSRKLEKDAQFYIKVAGEKLACKLGYNPEDLPTLGNDDHSIQLYSRILQEKGIEKLRIKELDFKFRSIPRATFVKARDFKGQVVEDEIFPGKKALVLSFMLPPGSYATMLLKVGEVCYKKMAGLPGFEPGSDG